MRWRWWRPEPEPGEHARWPDHSRDPPGGLHDGDRVRPEGWRGREDDLLAAEVAGAAFRALTEPTLMLDRPLMTRGQEFRGNGGRR